MKQRVLRVLWPAFLAAGVLEMLVFAVVDPAELHWFGGAALNWSSAAVHTVAFLVFWAVIAAASAATAVLSIESDALNEISRTYR